MPGVVAEAELPHSVVPPSNPATHSRPSITHPVSQPSSSASQQIPSFMPGAVYQGPDPSSSSGGFPPSSQAYLQGATNLLGLNFPPMTLEDIAQCQASGRLPPMLFNPPAQQQVQAATNSVATTTARFTARSLSQSKKSRSSPYSRGVPAPKQVSRPHEEARYQPPPSQRKARVRRAVPATKSKTTTTTSAVSGSSMTVLTNASYSNCGMTPSSSPPTVPSASLAQAAMSQGKATPNTASAGLPPNGDGGLRILTSALQSVPSHLALAEAISRQPGLGGISIKLVKAVLPSLVDTGVEVKCIRRSRVSIAGGAQSPRTGTSSSMPHSESSGPPEMGTPTMEEPGLRLAAFLLSGSFTPMMQPEGPPLVGQPQPDGLYPVMNAPEWLR